MQVLILFIDHTHSEQIFLSNHNKKDMKNLVSIIIMSLFVLMACNDDYLERYPLDAINDASFWNTPSDIEMYVNQFYENLPPLYGFFLLDNNSDNLCPDQRPAYIWDEYTVPASGGNWGKSNWLQIRRCNYALVRIAERMELTDEVKRYEGEIRFFKAFYYFDKVKMFGDVPWYDSDLQTDSEGLYVGRDSRKVIIDKILDDLDFAIANLPEDDPDDRLTKYAALAFKSEVCLFEGTFRKYHGLGDHEAMLRECVNAGEAIINSGKFEIWSTGNPASDYFDLFVQRELKGNPECIMPKRHILDVNSHNNTRYLGEASSGYSKDYVMSYLCTDGLPIAISPLYQGDDGEFDEEFVNRDPRMKQTIHTNERIYRIYSDGSVMYKPMPEFDLSYAPTSYLIIKHYDPLEDERRQYKATTDLFHFRYGRVLLEYAEAKAELGECTQEVLDKTINLLRDRVGMPHLTVDVGFVDPNWPDWEVPVSPLINEIRRERRIELTSECLRWDDLCRWKAGKRLEDPLTIRGARDPETGQYKEIYPGFTREWNDRLYLYPIPTQELTLNPALEQNPGWE